MALKLYPERWKIQTQDARIIFRAKNDENWGCSRRVKGLFEIKLPFLVPMLLTISKASRIVDSYHHYAQEYQLTNGVGYDSYDSNALVIYKKFNFLSKNTFTPLCDNIVSLVERKRKWNNNFNDLKGVKNSRFLSPLCSRIHLRTQYHIGSLIKFKPKLMEWLTLTNRIKSFNKPDFWKFFLVTHGHGWACLN